MSIGAVAGLQEQYGSRKCMPGILHEEIIVQHARPTRMSHLLLLGQQCNVDHRYSRLVLLLLLLLNRFPPKNNFDSRQSTAVSGGIFFDTPRQPYRNLPVAVTHDFDMLV